jgi:predicted nucleotidyltransferase
MQFENTLALQVAEHFAKHPQVEAVALGGSHSAGVADAGSDIDVYVFTRADIDTATRASIIAALGGASRANIGMTFWGPGDEWFHAPSGIEIDATYFDATWLEGQLERVILQHQPSLGYTTCFWRTVKQAQPLYDRRGWFAAMQQLSQAAYPEALRHNIIQFNHPVLRNVIPAYLHQIEKAVQRQDVVSVNHRVAALLASYFDILFALNRVLHPGEKRLLAYAQAECAMLPANLPIDVTALLASAASGQPGTIACANALLDHLDVLLEQEHVDVRGGL